MTGGILQLVARGIDDIFLMGNPEITFFKVVYRRYSNFSKFEEILSFDSKIKFGSSAVCKVKRAGDLVNRMYLSFDLPQIDMLYDSFTYNKLSDIMNTVGISVSDIYESAYETPMLINSLVTIDFFDNHFVPAVSSYIETYQDIITEAQNQLAGLQIYINGLNQNTNINKYLNPSSIPISPISTYDATYPDLQLKYKLIGKFIDIVSPTSTANVITNTQYGTISQLYDYLLNLYETVDNNKISMFDSGKIGNIIYNSTIKKLYMMDSTTVVLTAGYQPPNVANNMHDYVGDNLLLYDALNIADDSIVVINVTANNPMSQFFSNLIAGTQISPSLYTTLDYYLIYTLYINDTEITNPTIDSINNIVSVKDGLLSILKNSMVENLTQFKILLNILNNFTYKVYLTDVEAQDTLSFGIFYPSSLNSPTSTFAVVRNDPDKNIFFYDGDYTQTVTGAYYLNWVKSNVNSFFFSLTDVFTGLSSDTSNGLSYEFMPYFNDQSYMGFYNLIDNQLSPSNLSSILNGSNVGFTTTTLIAKIKFLEFTPFIVLYNVFNLLAQSSNLWNSGVTWGMSPNLVYSKYFNFLKGLYYVNPIPNGTTLRLTLLNNYLYNTTANVIGTATKIVVHLCTPSPVYAKTNIGSIITTLASLTTDEKNALGYMYVRYSVSTATFADVPDVLFPLDVILLWMATDIFLDLRTSSAPLTVNILLSRLLQLFFLAYDDIPLYTSAVIKSQYYNFIYYAGYLNIFAPNTTNSDVNSVHRLSSIWNYMCRTQMAEFNNLYINTLLSTTYYRDTVSSPNASYYDILTNVQSQAPSLGIGRTMQQAYELYIQHFFNDRLGISMLQTIPVESIIINTNFYTMALTDPTNTILDAINDITNNIIADITTVENNVSTYSELKTIQSISVNKSLLNYNTLFNIMTNGLATAQFVLDNNTVVLNNVTFLNNGIVNSDGYCAIAYKTYPSSAALLNVILGDVYNILQIAPMNDSLVLPSGTSYIQILNDFPVFANVGDTAINQGVMDIFMHFDNDIENPTLTAYLNTLLGLFNIHKTQTITEYPDTITLTVSYASTIYPIGEQYEIFLSPTNSTGNLFMIDPNNTNPSMQTNSDIVNKYWSFQTIYGIIKFLLDMIIYDIGTNPTFALIFGTNNNDIMLNNLSNYYQSVSNLMILYLNDLTINNAYIGSNIYNRLLPFRTLLDTNDYSAPFAWSEFIAFNAIDTIIIKIGDQEIDRHTGTWMYINWLMNKSKSQERSENILYGNDLSLTTYNSTTKPIYTVYINLQFWFNKFLSCAYPMIASKYADLLIEVRCKALEEIAYWNKNDSYFVNTPSIENGTIMADYIVVDSAERNFFATTKHEYLLEITQNTETMTLGYQDIVKQIIFNSSESSQANTLEIKLDFTDMCKDLFWICQFVKTDMSEVEKQYHILNWTDFAFNSMPKHFKRFKINFDSSHREDWKRAGYYNYLQPYKSGYSSLSDNIFAYSFGIFPKYLQPSGAANFNRLVEVSISIEIDDDMALALSNNEYKLVCNFYCKKYNVLRVFSGIAACAFYG